MCCLRGRPVDDDYDDDDDDDDDFKIVMEMMIPTADFIFEFWVGYLGAFKHKDYLGSWMIIILHCWKSVLSKGLTCRWWWWWWEWCQKNGDGEDDTSNIFLHWILSGSDRRVWNIRTIWEVEWLSFCIPEKVCCPWGGGGGGGGGWPAEQLYFTRPNMLLTLTIGISGYVMLSGHLSLRAIGISVWYVW